MRLVKMRWTLSCVVTSMALMGLARADVFIAEFDATNNGTVADVEDDMRDWIEIYNSGATPVNLAGWALSDDPDAPGKWIFPHVSVGANQHLLVFASKKDWSVAGRQLHTNFRLPKTGSILLSQPAEANGWSTVHAIVNYPKQRPGVSYGLASSSRTGTQGFFETPTPDGINSPRVVPSFVTDTKFSPKRGFYDAPFTAEITSSTPGATIVYTTDGSEPTETNGTRVAPLTAKAIGRAKIKISGTTVLRARAIKAGLGSTNIDTQTYIFPNQVLTQNGPPAGLKALPWSHNGTADWAMDATVVNHPDSNIRATAEDLKSIPTISLVMDWNDLFGGSRAIYPPGPDALLEPIGRRASLELISPDGSESHGKEKTGFSAAGKVRIVGNTSEARWNSDKLSFSFAFYQDLKFPLLGPSAAGRYDKIVLDARFNGVWTYGGQKRPEEQRAFSDYYGDAFVSDLHRQAGGAGVHTKVMHLYLNGLYWGIYSVHERPDHHFAAAYLGGDKDDWDVIRHDTTFGNVVAGQTIDPTQPPGNSNNTASRNYEALLKLASADLSVDANYRALAGKLDIPDFISYMLVNFYVGNTDWGHNNWYATFNRAHPDSKWRFHAWDSERVMVSVTGNVTEKNNAGGPTGIHQALRRNPEYRLLFADIAHRHLFNGGILTYPRIWNYFDERMQTFAGALRAESARWGDNRRMPPYTRVDWDQRRKWWESTYFPARSGMKGRGSIVRQLENQELYPSVSAPIFKTHGGAVRPNFKLTIAHPDDKGTIYFTTDGSDPRVPVTGTPSPQATPYSDPVRISGRQVVKARVLNGSDWSALNEASFFVDVNAPGMNGPVLAALIGVSSILISAALFLLWRQHTRDVPEPEK